MKSKNPHQKIIFVVDDNGDYLQTLVFFLKRQGYDAYGFEDPQLCLNQLTLLRPDLILSDYEMPHMNGLEFVKEVNRMLTNIPCLLVTGSIMPELPKKALNEGCAGILSKPFDISELIDAIEKNLAIKSQAI